MTAGLDRAFIALSLRNGRQLQNGRSLSATQVRDQNDLSVRKLDSVVMCGRALRVDLPETGDLPARLLLPENSKERSAPNDVFFERQFSPWQKADRNFRPVRLGETAGRRARKGRY
jgi:hypothetical protein